MGATTGCRLSINEELMPTKRERTAVLNAYAMGFQDGLKAAGATHAADVPVSPFTEERYSYQKPRPRPKKRKPSAWNKFVKANSKKPRFKYRNGKLNLKKMAVAFRKTPAGKKKRR